MKRAMRRMRKVLVMVACMALVAGLAIGGTLAWLAASTDPVTNTFTVGNIDIKLEEHKLKDDGTLDATETVSANSYHIIPGTTLKKDPFVTVKAKSEPCYLFIKVENGMPSSDDIEWSVLTKTDATHNYHWTALTEDADGNALSGVYYMEVNTSTSAQEFEILTGNQITIKNTLTKSEVDAMIANSYTLKITAYAVQQKGFEGEAAKAWAQASKASYSKTENDFGGYSNTGDDPAPSNP